MFKWKIYYKTREHPGLEFRKGKEIVTGKHLGEASERLYKYLNEIYPDVKKSFWNFYKIEQDMFDIQPGAFIDINQLVHHFSTNIVKEMNVIIKSVYGKRTIYPNCPVSHIFSKLVGRKVIPFEIIPYIIKLGYTINYEGISYQDKDRINELCKQQINFKE